MRCLPGGEQRDEREREKKNLDVPFFHKASSSSALQISRSCYVSCEALRSRSEVKWLKFESAEEAARRRKFPRHRSVKQGPRKTAYPPPLQSRRCLKAEAAMMRPAVIDQQRINERHGGAQPLKYISL